LFFSFVYILNHLIVVACGRVVGGEEVGIRDTRRGIKSCACFFSLLLFLMMIMLLL